MRAYLTPKLTITTAPRMLHSSASAVLLRGGWGIAGRGGTGGQGLF